MFGFFVLYLQLIFLKHYFMKKIYLLLSIIFVSVFSNAQTPVSGAFPQDFGIDPSSVPTVSNITGWSASDYSEIVLDDTQPSGVGVSSNPGNVVLFNNSNGTTHTLTFNSVPTTGFTGINVFWNQYNFTSSSVSVTVQWNNNVGSGWTNFSYTQPGSAATWALCGSIASLPPGAEGAANFSIRFIFAGNSSFDPTLIDDVNIIGNATPIYFYNGGGPIESLSSWDFFGTPGLNPANFTDANITYYLFDYVTFATGGALTGNWNIDGNGSVLYIGDGTGTGDDFNLDIPAGFALTLGGAGTPFMRVMSNSSLTIHNTSFPTANITFSTGSTVEYAQTSSVNINPQSYFNLIISGTNITHNNGVVTVNGDLNLASNLIMNNAAGGSSLSLNGTASGSGALMTRTNSKLVIGGTGSLGTINFGNGGVNKTLSTLTINRTSSGNINLGTDLTVTGSTIIREGNLNVNGNKLTLNGAITFSNTSSLGGSQSSSLSIGGSGVINNSLFMDPTNAGTKALDEFVLSRASRTVTLGNSMEVWGNITPSVGTIVAGTGNLTLKSDASHKARIGQIGATGFFTGNPTVEVFRPTLTTGWINLCTGGVTGNTFSGWNSSFAIVCGTCPSSTVGTGLSASIYGYNETLAAGSSSNSAAYIDLDALGGYSSTIDSKKGYYVYFGNTSPGSTSGAITVPLTGAVNTKNSSGNIALTKTGSNPTEDGWNLVANPYPSPIVANQITGSNFNNATIQAYDPTTDSFVSYSGSATIPMGQAFFVQATGSGNLSPAESWKVTANDNTSILRPATAGGYYFDDFLLSLTSNIVPVSFYTQAYFTFGNAYTTNYENGDCLSFEGTSLSTPRIVAKLNNATLKRSALPTLNGLTTIPILVTTGYAGVYSINPVNLNKLPAGACVSLFNIATNSSHDLKTGAYTTTIAANATTPQFELRITVTPASLTSNFTNPLCKKTGNGLLVAKGTGAGPWNYTWKDNNNTILKVSNNVANFDSLKNVAEGTYKVDVNTVGSCDNANTQFVLNATTPLPTALFIANATTVSAVSNVPVSFTNNSINASNYLWNFGDGATANTANTSHVYNTAGIFNIKLIATNGICADSSSANTQVQAIAGSAVGINNNTLANNNAFVSKDVDGVFVQLDFEVFTKTEITVTNILGQIITSKKIVVADKTKYYLSVPENEKIIFVTVEANNQKQTTKIIN